MNLKWSADRVECANDTPVLHTCKIDIRESKHAVARGYIFVDMNIIEATTNLSSLWPSRNRRHSGRVFADRKRLLSV